MIVLLSFIVAVLLMSLIEYIAHRWFMHSKRVGALPGLYGIFDRHTHLHHKRFYRNFEYDADPAAKYINLDIPPSFVLVGLSPIWLPLAMLVSVPVGLVFAGVFVGHAVLWTIIHTEMHEPNGRWFARCKLYQYLRDYHKTHHDHPNKNFNVVFPFMDRFFGTYRESNGR